MKLLVLMALLLATSLDSISAKSQGSPMGGQIRAIGLALYSCANDNAGNYPDGKSSTEVFQQLLDGGYVTDPAVFYFPMAGKVKGVVGQKLKPENVCFDFTAGANLTTSPTDLPLLFMSGYKITYAAGASAVPVLKPYPPYASEVRPQHWIDWLSGCPTIAWWKGEGAFVFYLNKSSAFKVAPGSARGEYSIPNFISREYNPNGKTYRQLTPDGVLEPRGTQSPTVTDRRYRVNSACKMQPFFAVKLSPIRARLLLGATSAAPTFNGMRAAYWEPHDSHR